MTLREPATIGASRRPQKPLDKIVWRRQTDHVTNPMTAYLAGSNQPGHRPESTTFEDDANANLSGAHLFGAVLLGANLAGADLTGADLTAAVGVDG